MPAFLVRPVHYAWLQTLLVSVKNQYTLFLTYRQQQLANVTINSSVNRLTQALWDNFDSTQSIYLLQNTTYQDEALVFLESDGATPAYDYLIADNHTPVDYDNLNVEYGSNYNFVVRIPSALAGSTSAIQAFVSRYIFSGISFTIQTF